MSGFLDKAKNMAGEVAEKVEPILDKIQDKLPDSVKSKVEPVIDKIRSRIPADKDAKTGSTAEATGSCAVTEAGAADAAGTSGV